MPARFVRNGNAGWYRETSSRPSVGVSFFVGFRRPGKRQNVDYSDG